MVCDVVGFRGRIVPDPTKPDGPPRKLMDVTKLRSMGWQPRYDLPTGLKHAYDWFVEHVKSGDARMQVG